MSTLNRMLISNYYFIDQSATITDFDKYLPDLKALYGDLERHHENNKIWVTRYSDNATVAALDLIEKELIVYVL